MSILSQQRKNDLSSTKVTLWVNIFLQLRSSKKVIIKMHGGTLPNGCLPETPLKKPKHLGSSPWGRCSRCGLLRLGFYGQNGAQVQQRYQTIKEQIRNTTNRSASVQLPENRTTINTTCGGNESQQEPKNHQSAVTSKLDRLFRFSTIILERSWQSCNLFNCFSFVCLFCAVQLWGDSPSNVQSPCFSNYKSGAVLDNLLTKSLGCLFGSWGACSTWCKLGAASRNKRWV